MIALACDEMSARVDKRHDGLCFSVSEGGKRQGFNRVVAVHDCYVFDDVDGVHDVVSEGGNFYGCSGDVVTCFFEEFFDVSGCEFYA